MTTDKIKQLSDSRSPPKRFKFKLRKILMSKADKQCKKCLLKLLDFQKDLAMSLKRIQSLSLLFSYIRLNSSDYMSKIQQLPNMKK